MSPPDKDPASPARPLQTSRLRLAGIALAVIAVLVVAAGLVTRAGESSALRKWTDEQAIPTVVVLRPAQSSEGNKLILPGRLEAYSSAPIYARVGGYLKSWKVDIGAQVKAGQLLAEIEAPDVEQQLLQARADLNAAQANQILSRATATRWQSLLDKGAVSRQELDEKNGDLAAKQALVRSAQANVDRLRAMMAFTHLVAPFDGMVTARNTDVGQLVVASAGNPLFVVSSVKRLRVYVNVPQDYVASVSAGVAATLSVPEHPGHVYNAKVDAAARSVTAASGTSLIELSVDNGDNSLLPGGYAEVRMNLPLNVVTLSIPASALIFDGEGTRVATLDANQRTHLQPVTIATDLGVTVAIGAGLSAGDQVIDSPPDGITEGMQVRVAQAAPAKT